jgi:hypothetical protein
MNKRHRDWKLDDPEVIAIFDGAIRSSKRSFYKIIDGRHQTAPLKSELIQLPMTAASASRLLAAYPFPEAPFIKNRKRDADLTEEALLAQRERQAIRKAKAATKAKEKSDVMAPIQVVEEVPEEMEELLLNSVQLTSATCRTVEASVNESTDGRKRPKNDPEELMESKNHCLVQRGEWFGIFHARDATVHLISKDRSEAVSALAHYGKVKECYQWSKN